MVSDSVSTNQVGKLLCAEASCVYFINEEQNGFVKVNTSTFDRLKVPLGDEKIYQISVSANRVFAVSENGNLIVCFRTRDKVLGLPTVKKTHMKDSDEEDHLSDDEGSLSKYDTKTVKITPNIDTVQDPDPLNSSVMAGSDNEENDDSHLTPSHRSKSELQHPRRSGLPSERILLPHD